MSDESVTINQPYLSSLFPHSLSRLRSCQANHYSVNVTHAFPPLMTSFSKLAGILSHPQDPPHTIPPPRFPQLSRHSLILNPMVPFSLFSYHIIYILVITS